MKKIFFLIFILFGCGESMERVEKRDFVLGTFGEIICISKKETCQRAVEMAFEEIRRLENIFSNFNRESEISMVNEAKGKPIKVSEETFALVKKAKEISQRTKGSFDITVSPLLSLWGFYDKENVKRPSPESIKKVLSSVGEDKIILDEKEKTIALREEAKIDLGGIAAGFIVDKVVEVLKKEGIKNGLVNIGGDIFCFGESRNKKGWRIGIQDPTERDKFVAVLNLKNKAIATSGQYEKFREIEGRRLGHIIDPHTGHPVEKDVLSVTVISDDCLTADALATAIFVLGKEGISFLKDFQAEAVIISRTEEGKSIWVSPGVEKYLVFTNY